MLKTHKWKILFSSALVLLPAAAGLLLWERLPVQMSTHWGLDGAADGESGRAVAVFVLPLMLLAAHLFCLFVSDRDFKKREQDPKVIDMVLWIIPFTSLIANGFIYAAAFGWQFSPFTILPIFLGLLFLVVGNYLPKCRQNRTVGVKIKWTLENEENWNATHRMCGKLWVAGGLLMLACVFLPEKTLPWVVSAVLVVMIAAPVAYSRYYYQKKQKADSAAAAPTVKSVHSKPLIIVSVVGTLLVLALAAGLMFTGEITVAYGDTAFTVDSSYWHKLTVEYDAVETAELRQEAVPGTRIYGLGSARLLAGQFQNEEFGNYTRYTYTGAESCVVLTVEGKILVISGPDAAATREIYKAILARK